MEAMRCDTGTGGGRFSLLLWTLLLAYALQPLFGSSIAGRIALNVMISVVLVTSLRGLAGRALHYVGAVLAAAALIGWWAHWVVGDARLAAGSAVLTAALLALVSLAALAAVLQAETVGRETMLGAVCAYLLLGFVWAFLYFLVEVFVPGSFTFAPALLASLGDPPVGAPLPAFIYYSLITLTTVGYGDVTPLGSFARTLATLEALAGQLFLAVVVAQLVGARVAQARGSGSAPDDRSAT